MKNSPFAITLEKVTVDYIHTSGGRTALHDISLQLAVGSWTALVGENGSGKSTLAKALAGISPLTEGKLEVHGGKKPHIVLQNPETQLLGDTIYEELGLSMSDIEEYSSAELRSHMRDTLAAVGLAVPLDARVSTLSGGQKQLLNIACCIAGGAAAIIYDEATSMLDPASRRLVLEATASLHRAGATIVWITHRMEELCYADRVIALERGGIAFDGAARLFFYGDAQSQPSAPSPCEALGCAPPYTVRTARELQRLGHALPLLPLSPEQFSAAVAAL